MEGKDIKEPIIPILRKLEIGEEHAWPRHRTPSVRARRQNEELREPHKKFATSLTFKPGYIVVRRIK